MYSLALRNARFINIVLISSQGVKGYNNTCLCQCAYLAYLNDNNTSKTKKVTSGQWPKLPYDGRNDPEALY